MSTDEKIDKLIETVARIDTRLDALIEPAGRVSRAETDIVALQAEVKSLSREGWLWHGITLALAYAVNLVFGKCGH